MATVGTHDVPPVAGFVTGDQVTVRARLGLLTTSTERERAESAAKVARWQAALVAEGLLPPADQQPDAGQFTTALYGYLSKTPSLFARRSSGGCRPANVRNLEHSRHGTEYPNWQIPLCDDQGRAVLLEHLPGNGLLRRVCAAVRGGELASRPDKRPPGPVGPPGVWPRHAEISSVSWLAPRRADGSARRSATSSRRSAKKPAAARARRAGAGDVGVGGVDTLLAHVPSPGRRPG